MALLKSRQVRDCDPESHWGKLGPGPRCAVLMLESCWFGRKGQRGHRSGKWYVLPQYVQGQRVLVAELELVWITTLSSHNSE